MIKTYNEQLEEIIENVYNDIVKKLEADNYITLPYKVYEYDNKYVHHIKKLENGEIYIVYGAHNEMESLDYISFELTCKLADYLNWDSNKQ